MINDFDKDLSHSDFLSLALVSFLGQVKLLLICFQDSKLVLINFKALIQVELEHCLSDHSHIVLGDLKGQAEHVSLRDLKVNVGLHILLEVHKLLILLHDADIKVLLESVYGINLVFEESNFLTDLSKLLFSSLGSLLVLFCPHYKLSLSLFNALFRLEDLFSLKQFQLSHLLLLL